MIAEDEIYSMTTRNRLMIADLLEGLDDSQWQSPSLCRGWTVGHVGAHLLQPMLVGFGRFLVAAVRFRGDTDRTVDQLARRLPRERHEVVALLRAHADDRVSPRRVGPWGPFAETCIHLRDIARPLGLDADVPTEHWVRLLGYLTSSQVAPALVPDGRIDGLRLVATDADRSWGSGDPVQGPAEALGMALAGRPAALADLHGEGVARLARRLGSASAVR